MYQIRVYPGGTEVGREAASRDSSLCFVEPPFKVTALDRKVAGKCETWARGYLSVVTSELRATKLSKAEQLERRAGLLADSIRAYFPAGGLFAFAEPTNTDEKNVVRRAAEILSAKAVSVGLVA